MGVVEYKKHTKILVTNFNLEDDTLSFFGEIQATGNDAYLEAFNHLLDTLKSSLRKKMTVTFRNTCLKDDVFSSLIFPSFPSLFWDIVIFFTFDIWKILMRAKV